MITEDSFIIVNTDLDATLLDHDTYSWEPAKDALSLLQEKGIPLVLNSSKTLAEMQSLAADLGLNYPLVCENGSLIAVPHSGDLTVDHIRPHVKSIEEEGDYWICYLGESRAEVLEKVSTLKEGNSAYVFQGYTDWSVSEVAEHTGLPMESAALSHQRRGTEPIHWHGTEGDFQAFSEELAALGVKCVSGGRFIHLSGNSDKAIGLETVNAIYREQDPQRNIITIALGDSPNDLGMLNSADIAVVIPNKVALNPTAPEVIHASQHGPSGWNTELCKILGD